MPRVTHFYIDADDPERAAKFYSDLFGWKIDKWEGRLSTGWSRLAPTMNPVSMAA